MVGVYGFIFFRDTNWVTVIIDEFVRFYPDRMPSANFVSAYYTRLFPNLRNSVMRRNNYTTTTRQSTTSLHGKAARVFILPNPERREKHGCLSSRKHMRSSMEITLRYLEVRHVKLSKISLGAFIFQCIYYSKPISFSPCSGVSCFIPSNVRMVVVVRDATSF